MLSEISKLLFNKQQQQQQTRQLQLSLSLSPTVRSFNVEIPKRRSSTAAE
jgi:hypothetical protein